MNEPSVPARTSEERPPVSVIVFAREARDSIAATLESLAAQAGIDEAEVIVADASSDGTSELIAGEFPWVRHLRLGPCTMPEGKARAIEASSGALVAVIDAVDQAAPDWLHEIREGFASAAEEVQAIGGEVSFDGEPGRANGPGYLFEYGAFAPRLEAQRTEGDLPGNNVAYRREVFDETCAELLADGFYKPLFHDKIRSTGGQLRIHPKMRVKHRIRSSLLSFCARRFQYGRCFGSIRLREAPSSRKWLYILFVPLVPALLSVRHFRRAWQHPTNRVLLLRCFPGLLLLCIAWGLGEWLGTWFGAGRSWTMVY